MLLLVLWHPDRTLEATFSVKFRNQQQCQKVINYLNEFLNVYDQYCPYTDNGEPFESLIQNCLLHLTSFGISDWKCQYTEVLNAIIGSK